MTRARRQVRFFTVNGKPSQFLVELAKNKELVIQVTEGEAVEPCPKCARGVLVLRNGPYGEFQACSRIAQCDFKRNLGKAGNFTFTKKTRVVAKPGDSCPACRCGRMVKKNGRYSAFVACSEWPKCDARG